MPWLNNVEQSKTNQTLHPAPYTRLQVKSTQWSSVSLRDAEMRAIHLSFVVRRLFVRGGSALATITTAAATSGSLNPLPSPPSSRRLAVRCTSSLFMPTPSLSAQVLILLTSHRIHEPQPPRCSTAVVRYQVCKEHISKDAHGTTT